MKKILSFSLALSFLFIAMFSVPAYADSKPTATSITSLTAGTNKFTVKWKKKNVSGYQIQYSRNSDFSSSKKINVKSSKTTSKKVKNLKGKKKYYVRVRTYKLKDGNKVYSSWSKKRSVTTKASSVKRGTVVYITPTGKKYHYSKSCAGKNAIKTTLSEAKKTHDPCKKCAG